MTILALYQSVRVPGRRTLKQRGARIGLIRTLLEDLDVVVARDPSTRSRLTALGHPGVLAMWGYRVAHRLYVRGLRRLPLRIAAAARVASRGITIHPGASLGRRVLLDRAGAIDVCESAVIGDDVIIGNDVRLSITSWFYETPPVGPVIADGAVIGDSVRVAGPVRVGTGATIAPATTVIADVADGAKLSSVAPRPGGPLPSWRTFDTYAVVPKW